MSSSLSEYQWNDILRRVAFCTVTSVCKSWLRLALSDEQRWLRVRDKRCHFRMFYIADMIVPLVDRTGLAVRSLSAFSRHLRVAGRRYTFDVVRAHFIAGPLVEPAGAMRALLFAAQDPVHRGDDRILEPLHGIVDTIIVDRTQAAPTAMALPWASVTNSGYTPLRHYCVHIPSVQRVVLQLRDTTLEEEHGVYDHVTSLAVDATHLNRSLLADLARVFPRIECLALRCDNLFTMHFLHTLLQRFPHATKMTIQNASKFARRFESVDDPQTVPLPNRLQRLYIHSYFEDVDTATLAAQLAPTADIVLRSVNETLPERCVRAIDHVWAHMAGAL